MKRFDRKTFDPLNNGEDLRILNTLRGFGASRRIPSSAAEQAITWAKASHLKARTALDLGCGDSRDCLHFSQAGIATVHRMDLFPPHIYLDQSNRNWANFIQGDIADKLPFADQSIDLIICQAVIDLIEPDARNGLYQEIRRILAPSGLFICYAQELSAGWGFTPKIEVAKLRALFPSVVAYGNIWRCHTIPQARYIQADGTYNLPMEIL
jgi:SAM-dependent methyltransferase